MNKNDLRMTTGTRLMGPAVIINILCAATALTSASAATTTADTAPADVDAIQEIVVTAEKRSESLQSVPVSVTALTRAQLGQLKMDSPSDLVTQVPN